MSIKFLLLGGGYLGFFLGGGECRFYFYGRGAFPALCPKILGTRFTNYGLRMFWGELMVI